MLKVKPCTTFTITQIITGQTLNGEIELAKSDGVDHSPAGIEAIREQIITLRNSALEKNNFTWSVILTHCVAMLADYKEMVESG